MVISLVAMKLVGTVWKKKKLKKKEDVFKLITLLLKRTGQFC